MMRSKSPAATRSVLAALATLCAAGACNYDFDEFSALGPPVLDGGSAPRDGSGGTGHAGNAGTGAGKSGAGGAYDGGKGGNGGSGGAGGASGGAGGSSGSTGSGGAGAVGGAGGTAGAAGSGASGGTGGSGPTGGTAGSGGSVVDASADGAGAGGTGTGGTSTGGGGSGTGTGGAGTGGTGTGDSGTGTGGTGTGGSGTGGSGTGGSDAGSAGTSGSGGSTNPTDSGARDIRIADVTLDRIAPPFNCAAAGGRVFENHCYYASSTSATWEVAAQKSCAAPAHLVTITSAAEHEFVVSFLTDASRWIGLHRPTGSPKNPASFEWVTGETRTYTHWYSANGEPDYDGDCVRLGPSNNWGDHPCTAQLPAICERE